MQIVLPMSNSPGAWHVVQASTGLATSTPQAQQDTVLVVPWSWLSWHRITVPPNSHRQLRAIAASLLEDELLQAPDQLHLSFDSHAHAVARKGGEISVAVCEQQRLQAVWQDLANQGCLPERIVPELWPCSDGVQLHWLQTPSQAMRVWSHALGLMALPEQLPFEPQELTSRPLSDLKRLTAEPALVPQAQAWQARLARTVKVEVQDLNARLLSAAQSPWNLAQGKFEAQHPWVHALRSRWQWLRHDAQAKAHRWAWVSLVGVHVLGWGLSQWQHLVSVSHLQERIDRSFARALPNTPQLDAPAQLAQALRRLEQMHGVASPHDLPALLSAWAQAMPQHPLTQWRYQHDVLQAQNLEASAMQAARAVNWAAWGLQAELDNAQVSLRVRPVETPGTSQDLVQRAQQVQSLSARIQALRERPRNPDQTRAALQTLTVLGNQQGQWRFTPSEAELQARQVSAAQLGQWLIDWPAHARVSVVQAQASASASQWQVQMNLRLPTP